VCRVSEQHTGTSQPSRQLLELLHTDVMGPMPESLRGSKYVVTVLASAACVARPVSVVKVQEVVGFRTVYSAGKTVSVNRMDLSAGRQASAKLA
jgi:hypothetical protein